MARSGGSLVMRSTPTLSMEDGGSHNGLRERCRGRARAGDDEPDTRRNGMVGGGWGLVLLIRLRLLSWRRRWRLLFLIDQAGETEV
jgi:hypothetical protein